MNNAVFVKAMQNVRQYRDLKLVTTERTRNNLVSEPKCHNTKCFTKNLLAIEMKRILMNKPVYLGLLILDLSKTVMFELWYDQKYFTLVKQKYGENEKLCYINTDRFIVHVKTDDIYKDILEDCETRFDASNYKIDRPLLKAKNKKGVRLMKDELSR